MARGGMIRGAASAWLGLIALQAVSTRGGSGRVAEFFNDANRLVQRVLDPNVPAIPDRRGGATAGGWLTGVQQSRATAPPPATEPGQTYSRDSRLPIPGVPLPR